MGEAATLDPRPGGVFLMTIAGCIVQGEYVEVQPPYCVGSTWESEAFHAGGWQYFPPRLADAV